MLLKKLDVVNSRSAILGLPLDDGSTGFVVRDIQGLGPVKATLVSSSFANMDGSQYHSSRRENRNIVIQLGLDPDYAQYSVYDLRAELYDFLMPKTSALLKFNLFDKFSTNIIEQNLNVEINGVVESLEPSMFTKDPGVDLSIMCFDPDFIDPAPVTLEGLTTDGLTETPIEYAGTVETGLLFTLLPDRPMSEVTIYHIAPDNTLRTVYFAHPLVAGQTVKINSVPGSKYVTLEDDGVETSILYALTPQSNWLELVKGENKIRVYAEGAPVPFKIEYLNRYGGL